MDNNSSQNDYLPCNFYNGKTPSADGIYKFPELGKYYFSFMENGNVILRSEGYTTEAGRENGIVSILKNMENENLYKVLKLDDGTWVLQLLALNHQEIARSCAFATEAEAQKLLPGARAKAREALLLKKYLETDNKEDDYLVCGEYEKRINERSPDFNNFLCFRHPSTNKFYFAWVTADNNIILRSEGYPSIITRDHGLASVIKNREIEERFKIEEKKGLYYLILTAGNYQEIGRSCPKKSEAELWAMIKPPIEAPALSALLVAASIPKIKNTDKEDDYLLCNEYHGHLVTDTQNNIALFTHSNGQYYFVVYNNDSSVKLRSEGFSNTSDRDQELSAVIKHVNSSSNYSRIEKAGYEIKILKDNNGREIGRTCPKKIFVAAAPIAVEVPSTGGFKWWWLLGLLALIGLFFLWKSCNKPEAEIAAPLQTVDTTVQVAPVAKDSDGDGINDDVDKCPNTAGIADNMGCPEMVFYYKRADANLSADEKADLDKLVDWMGKHPELSISVEGHTSTLGDSVYNQKLSEERVQNSVKYLVSKGIDANRLKAVGYGEQFPIGDNSTEEGRTASRRVVMKIAK